MILEKLKNIIIALLGLTFVIVVHELGHFTACKLFKVRTPVFSIGFDPAILSHKIGNTKFQIGALPIGGYVSIDNRDLVKLPYVKRMIIILAGIFFNLLFTFSIFHYLSRKAKSKLVIENNNSERDTFAPTEETFAQKAKQALPKKKRTIIGPIGIISMMAKSWELGFDVFLYFLAIISLNIAIFNILPVPFFDGGQALQVTIEALFGKSLPVVLMNLLSLIFFILLLIFSIILSIKDVKRLQKIPE